MVSQLLAVTIFVIMLAEIIRNRFPRHLVALVAGGATLVLVYMLVMQSPDTVMVAMSLDSLFDLSFWYTSPAAPAAINTGINWSTILFISGMIIMVEGMSEAGFFDWLCLRLAKLVHYKPAPLFLCFMILAALLSMFINSITVILFLSVTSVLLGRLLRVDPVPFILTQIFAANLGGAATMSGDPPNIIIGTSLGYSFSDFLLNTGLIVLLGLLLLVPFSYLFFRRALISGADPDSLALKDLEPGSAVHSRKKFMVSMAIFLLTIVLLITHAITGLSVATVGVIGALLTVAANRSPSHLLKRINWDPILFLMGLFLAVSGLELTGVLTLLANGIASVGETPAATLLFVFLLAAVASAFVDNIPFAATMVPVIHALSTAAVLPLDPLAWTLALGTNIGGAATPIGASANVAGLSVAARDGHPITWRRYCSYAIPASILVLALTAAMLLFRYA